MGCRDHLVWMHRASGQALPHCWFHSVWRGVFCTAGTLWNSSDQKGYVVKGANIGNFSFLMGRELDFLRHNAYFVQSLELTRTIRFVFKSCPFHFSCTSSKYIRECSIVFPKLQDYHIFKLAPHQYSLVCHFRNSVRTLPISSAFGCDGESLC